MSFALVMNIQLPFRYYFCDGFCILVRYFGVEWAVIGFEMNYTYLICHSMVAFVVCFKYDNNKDRKERGSKNERQK